MKVLLVCHGYPPSGVGGVERVSAQAAEALIERGHEVTVLTRQPSEFPSTLGLQRDTRAGVPVISIVGGGSTFGRFPGYEPLLERIFERTLIDSAPDVVIAAHLLHHSPGYVPIAQRWGIPVVLELHDFFMLCPRVHLQRRSGELCAGPEGGRACAAHCFGDQGDTQLRWALRSESFAEAVRCADEVIAPSRFVAEKFECRRGAAAPIQILENAVANFGPTLRNDREPTAPLHLASIGVTVEHKGPQVVVEALRLARLSAARYTILGVALPPLSRELHEAADDIPGLELRLSNGFVPSHLPALLADADVVVVASVVAETFSIVVREAFACGLPVIASRIGALPDAIRPGENGWLIEPGDALDLAVLLQRLNGERQLLRRAARGIRQSDVTSVVSRTDRLEAMLEALVEGGHKGGEVHGNGLELTLMRDGLAAADAARRLPYPVEVRPPLALGDA